MTFALCQDLPTSENIVCMQPYVLLLLLWLVEVYIKSLATNANMRLESVAGVAIFIRSFLSVMPWSILSVCVCVAIIP